MKVYDNYNFDSLVRKISALNGVVWVENLEIPIWENVKMKAAIFFVIIIILVLTFNVFHVCISWTEKKVKASASTRKYSSEKTFFKNPLCYRRNNKNLFIFSSKDSRIQVFSESNLHAYIYIYIYSSYATQHFFSERWNHWSWYELQEYRKPQRLNIICLMFFKALQNC